MSIIDFQFDVGVSYGFGWHLLTLAQSHDAITGSGITGISAIFTQAAIALTLALACTSKWAATAQPLVAASGTAITTATTAPGEVAVVAVIGDIGVPLANAVIAAPSTATANGAAATTAITTNAGEMVAAARGDQGIFKVTWAWFVNRPANITTKPFYD